MNEELPTARNSGELPYSLPHISEISGRDDWTTVKDRIIKKRIQNRVAQRTYRQRMKSRVADLQAKLEHCEQRLGSRRADHHDNNNPGTESPLESRNTLQFQSATASPLVDDSSSSGSEAAGHVPQSSGDFSSSLVSLLPEKIHGTEQCFSLLPEDNPQESESSQPETGIADIEVPFPKRLTTEHDSTEFTNGDPLEPYLPAEFNSWDSNKLGTPMQEMTWTVDSTPTGYIGSRSSTYVTGDVSATTPTSCDMAERPASGEADVDIDERVSSILAYMKTMGFENFDQFASTYYCHHFRDTSLICNEQRLSRNRRLPTVLASVCDNATKWSSWERRGFQEEILKATEAMLLSECRESHTDLETGAVRALVASPYTQQPIASIFSPLKKCIVNQVSNPKGEEMEIMKKDCFKQRLVVRNQAPSNQMAAAESLGVNDGTGSSTKTRVD